MILQRSALAERFTSNRMQWVWTILFVLASYVPFLGLRVIRVTGDEKVYIAQALEMAARGDWFVQTLAGLPDYYKGPLHYILLRLGLKTFGLSMWTAVYMNLVWILIGSLAVVTLVREAFPKKRWWPVWAGSFFASNVGNFGHLYASQMEVELSSAFALGFFFLWKERDHRVGGRYELGFWLLAGLVGWIKSPLHSVLLGVTALVFWLLSGNFVSRLKAWQTYAYGCAGIALCLAGYFPAWWYDRENFIATYIVRENASKGFNGGPWWQSLVSITTYYLFPWMSVAVLSYFSGAFGMISKKLDFKRPAFQLAFSAVVPTVLFFCLHKYRGENYTLPVIAGLILMILCFIEKDGRSFVMARRWVVALTSIFFLLVPIVFTVAARRFDFSQFSPGNAGTANAWWPAWALASLWILSGLAILFHFFEALRSDGLGPYGIAGNFSFLFSISILMAILGEQEVLALKTQITQDRAQGIEYSIRYWNLNRLLWNEWGLMSLVIHEPIQSVQHEEDLALAIGRGDLILARDSDQQKTIDETAAKHFPNLRPHAVPWDRWRSHPYAYMPAAWEKRDVRILFDHGLMVRYLSEGSSSRSGSP